MCETLIHISEVDETGLQSLARHIAAHLQQGDVLLLKGPVGAGKSTFARAAIKSLLLEDEDVPSPTFTLVQTYETNRGSLWHCDLYRANSASELEELGLHDAFSTAICMIEWPEILGEIAANHALTLELSLSEDGLSRSIRVHGNAKKWASVKKLSGT